MENSQPFLKVLGAAGITVEQFTESTKSDTPDEIFYKKLKLIAKHINGDWVADFTNSDQYKYTPYFYHNGTEFVFTYVHGWYSTSNVGSRLCYKSRKDAEKAATTFIEEYRGFLS